MSTKDRIERLRLELRYLTIVPPRKRGARLQSDIDRIKLRISMLTEDEGKPMLLPEVERRAYK